MSNFELENSIGSLLSKTKWYLNTYFNKMIKENKLDITTEQWVLLIIISKTPGISQTEIAKKGLKDKTNVTRMLDVLERNGYLTRKKDKLDRRIYRIFLTKKGEDILNKIYPIVYTVNKESCKNLKDKELTDLKNYLTTICNTIKKNI